MAHLLEERLPNTLSDSTAFFLNQIEYLEQSAQDAATEALFAAAGWHNTQRRKSGALYIIHPIHVASIAASTHADLATIEAALLHDVVEDTSTKLSEVEHRFGNNVAQLVEAVTRYPAFSQRQFLEKVYARAQEDSRIAVIKVADCCNNLMRHDQLLFSAEKHLEQLQEAREYYLGWLVTVPDFPLELTKMLTRIIDACALDYQNRLDPTYDTFAITPRYTRYSTK